MKKKQYMVAIKMSKEERERGVRKAAELYHKMNLEPTPGGGNGSGILQKRSVVEEGEGP